MEIEDESPTTISDDDDSDFIPKSKSTRKSKIISFLIWSMKDYQNPSKEL